MVEKGSIALTSLITEGLEFDVTVVIPALNEAKGIGLVLDDLSSALTDCNYSVLVVDGNSSDGTDKIAMSKGARVIYQKKKGYGDALKTGFLYARENFETKTIVMMDADNTYDPYDIPQLLKPLLLGEADIVVGNRFSGMKDGSMSSVNRFGNKVISWFARVTLGVGVLDTQCGLRAFKTELVDRFDFSASGMPFATEMLVDAKQGGANVSEIPISYRSREGDTKLNPWKDGLKIFGTIARLMRDTKPLLFFGMIGGVLGLAGLLLGVDIVFEWLTTSTVDRIPTLLLSMLLIFLGVQSATLGLVADMIKGFKTKVRGTR
jgi:dolichol-phosphate mannosyltransferase